MPYVFNPLTGRLDFTNSGSSFDPHSPGPIGDVTPSTGAFTSITSAPGTNESGLSITAGSITGSGAAPFLSVAGQWDTSGDPVALKVDLTGTAFGEEARIIDLRIDGVSRFYVGANGTVEANGNVSVVGDLYADWLYAAGDVKGEYVGANYAVQIAGNAQLSAPDWGVVCLTDQLETDLSRLCLGSSSSANPALAVDGPGVVVRLADDSADTFLRAARIILSDVPTSNPGVAGMIWSDGGVLKIV